VVTKSAAAGMTGPGPAPAPGSTVLGSFLQFTGVACSGFDRIVRESGRPVLVRAGQLADSWRDFFAGAGIPAPADLLPADLRGLLDGGDGLARALAEYDALFRAPELPVPLWESVWVSAEGTLFTEETWAVRDWYARFHWEILRAGYEAEDHLGFETAFCGWLFDAAAGGAGQGGDPERPRPTLADLRGFLDGHFSRWAPECFARLAGQAQTPFWSHLLASAAALARALAEDI